MKVCWALEQLSKAGWSTRRFSRITVLHRGDEARSSYCCNSCETYFTQKCNQKRWRMINIILRQQRNSGHTDYLSGAVRSGVAACPSPPSIKPAYIYIYIYIYIFPFCCFSMPTTTPPLPPFLICNFAPPFQSNLIIPLTEEIRPKQSNLLTATMVDCFGIGPLTKFVEWY